MMFVILLLLNPIIIAKAYLYISSKKDYITHDRALVSVCYWVKYLNIFYSLLL